MYYYDEKFQFDIFLENYILLFVSYEVIKFETIENIHISMSKNHKWTKKCEDSLNEAFFILCFKE